MIRPEWYTIDNIQTLDTPALAVYPDLVKENIRILRDFVPDTTRLRPHVKTHKSPEITKMMLAEGIRKFKCATIAEAEMLAAAGTSDILLAYQPVGPKANRLATLVKKFPSVTFACLVDDVSAAKHLADVFRNEQQKIRVFIDLNVGMNRTGIKPENALGFCSEILGLDGILFAGLHAYDGHIRDVDFEARTKKCNDAFAAVEKLSEEIKNLTGQAPAIIAGGTPTFPIHAKRHGVDCSPGTFIYWDKGYHSILEEQPFLFAALVVTRVVSKPTEGILCTDLGHKSIASENTITNRVTFLNAPDLEPVGHSEEHMVFKTENWNGYQVGDVLYGVPYHICPTVALHDRTAIVQNNHVTTYWNTVSRNRIISV